MSSVLPCAHVLQGFFSFFFFLEVGGGAHFTLVSFIITKVFRVRKPEVKEMFPRRSLIHSDISVSLFPLLSLSAVCTANEE